MQMREAHLLLYIIALTMSIIRWHGARWRKLLSQWLPNTQQRVVCGSDFTTQLVTIGSTTFYEYFIMLSPRFSLILSLNYRDRNNGKRFLFFYSFTVKWKIFSIASSKFIRKSIVSLEQSPTSLTMSGRLRRRTWEWFLMSKFRLKLLWKAFNTFAFQYVSCGQEIFPEWHEKLEMGWHFWYFWSWHSSVHRKGDDG